MRELPQDTNAEVWLLGAVLQDPSVMAQYAAALTPGDFYLEKHQLIWRAMSELQASNSPIDVITVSSKLTAYDVFKSLFGNNDYIFSIMESVSSAANVDYYVELINKASNLRKLISAAQKTINDAYAPAANADEILTAAMERISSIIKSTTKSAEQHVSSIANQALITLEQKMKSGEPTGLKTGFYDIDEITGGLRDTDLTILAARTRMGKTAFALNIAMYVAQTTPVLFFSLEMSAAQLAPRIISYYTNINIKSLTNAQLKPAELETQKDSIIQLQHLNLFINDESNQRIENIISSIYAFVAKYGKTLVIIDHLHFHKSKATNSETLRLEIGKITYSLKQTAKALKIPIMLLSQVNRDSEKQLGTKKPHLGSLKDSASIEQDGDCVWFVYRGGEYNDKIPKSDTDIIIAKNRNGPCTEVKLYFDTSTNKFYDAPQY